VILKLREKRRYFGCWVIYQEVGVEMKSERECSKKLWTPSNVTESITWLFSRGLLSLSLSLSLSPMKKIRTFTEGRPMSDAN
jgi:hypothetical protein